MDGPGSSWRITIHDFDLLLDIALWLREAERIPAEPDSRVPGYLEPATAPQPLPTMTATESTAAAWTGWWHRLLAAEVAAAGRSRPNPAEVAARFTLGPPGFPALAEDPALRMAAMRRQQEALAWHDRRKRAGVEAFVNAPPQTRLVETNIVRAVETEIGRRANPFQLRFVVIPVADNEVRRLDDRTFLLSERFRAGAAYRSWLRELVHSFA